ncbi:MAG: hypothetical protein GY782_00480 [Gammaproteobacteria bacterium]|nr:hypothetical protein [Gammaproteobacteria bacterium]
MGHAGEIQQGEALETEIPEREGVERLIGEMDGTMIPIVEVDDKDRGENIDLRKTRKVGWKEARLCLTRVAGSVTSVFGGAIGTVEDAGDQWANCAIRSNIGTNTKVHCVGDGASWISDQADRIFGLQTEYLLDFYHLCDYLSAAGGSCAPKHKEAWMNQQKERMKENCSHEVLKELKPHLEPDTIPDKDAPVRVCYRYITNHLDQLDYKGALAAHLPIGSGEIESSHRHVIQERLKISGAWWKIENARKMLALRILRANNDWNKYWSNLYQ